MANWLVGRMVGWDGVGLVVWAVANLDAAAHL